MSVLVVGAGGHAKVVVATLQALGKGVDGCLDDDPEAAGRSVLGVPVIGSIDRLRGYTGDAVLGIGSNRVRQALALSYAGVAWLTAVHPAATVHPSVDIGAGTVVFAGAVVQPDVRVGAHAILNTGCSVDHDGTVGQFAHVAPGVHLSGNVTVGEGGFVGVGACVIPGVTIGEWGVVGAGSAVVCDLPANATSLGVPARPRDQS